MTENRTQIGLGPLLAGVAAVILLISLFLDWFEPGLTAWTAFEIIDLLLAAIALAMLASVIAAVAPRMLAWRPSVPLWLLGAAAFVLVTSQLLNHPPAAQESDLEVGAWLAFGASLLAIVAGLPGVVNITLAREGTQAAATPVTPAPTGATRVMHEPADRITTRQQG